MLLRADHLVPPWGFSPGPHGKHVLCLRPAGPCRMSAPSSPDDVASELSGDSWMGMSRQYLRRQSSLASVARLRARSLRSISRLIFSSLRSRSHSVAARPHHQSSLTVSSWSLKSWTDAVKICTALMSVPKKSMTMVRISFWSRLIESCFSSDCRVGTSRSVSPGGWEGIK